MHPGHAGGSIAGPRDTKRVLSGTRDGVGRRDRGSRRAGRHDERQKGSWGKMEGGGRACKLPEPASYGPWGTGERKRGGGFARGAPSNAQDLRTTQPYCALTCTCARIRPSSVQARADVRRTHRGHWKNAVAHAAACLHSCAATLP